MVEFSADAVVTIDELVVMGVNEDDAVTVTASVASLVCCGVSVGISVVSIPFDGDSVVTVDEFFVADVNEDDVVTFTATVPSLVCCDVTVAISVVSVDARDVALKCGVTLVSVVRNVERGPAVVKFPGVTVSAVVAAVLLDADMVVVMSRTQSAFMELHNANSIVLPTASLTRKRASSGLDWLHSSRGICIG